MNYDDDNVGSSRDSGSRPNGSSDASTGGSTGAMILTIFANLLLLAGASLAILFFFLPLLDNNRVIALRSELRLAGDKAERDTRKDEKKLSDEERTLRKEQRKINKEASKLPFDKDNSEKLKAIQTRNKEIDDKLSELAEKRDEMIGATARDKWETDKIPLQEKVDEAEATARSRSTWNVFGMMAGFFITTLGAVVYLCSGANRIAGAILIFAVLSAVYSIALGSIVFARF